jgi:hypothetical protein
MSQAGTKLRKSEPAQSNGTAATLPIHPGEVMSKFEQICVSLPASGALIGVRDLSGVRCTVSFGTAPAVGSRVPTNFLFLKRCIEDSEVALCSDAAIDPAIHPYVAKTLAFRSAVGVPIRAQGSVVGLIEIFSPKPCAIGSAVIDGLKEIAKSFASLMIFDAADGGQPLVGGPLTSPVVLPRLEATTEPAAVATTTRSTFATSIPARATVERATKTETVAKVATLSPLPSDRPTPRRVWIIASVLLVALAVLLLLLFRNSHRESEDSSTESTNRGASVHMHSRAEGNSERTFANAADDSPDEISRSRCLLGESRTGV